MSLLNAYSPRPWMVTEEKDIRTFFDQLRREQAGGKPPPFRRYQVALVHGTSANWFVAILVLTDAAGDDSQRILDQTQGWFAECGAAVDEFESLTIRGESIETSLDHRYTILDSFGTVVKSHGSLAARPAEPPKEAADTLRVTCQHCKKTLRVKAAAAGKSGKCPHCQQTISIPPAAKRGHGPVEKPARAAPAAPAEAGPAEASPEVLRLIDRINTPGWKLWVSRNAKTAAAHDLARLGEAAIPSLVCALAQPGGSYAIVALREIGEAALPACLRALDGPGQANACLVVSEIGKGRIDQVIQQFQGKGAAFASLALVEMGPAAVWPLALAMRSHDGVVRMWTALTLRKFGKGAEQALPALRAAESADPDEGVRKASQAAVDVLATSTRKTDHLIRQFWFSDDREVVLRAHEELAKRGNAALDAMTEWFTPAIRERLQFFKSMGPWRDEDARTFIQGMLTDIDKCNLPLAGGQKR